MPNHTKYVLPGYRILPLLIRLIAPFALLNLAFVSSCEKPAEPDPVPEPVSFRNLSWTVDTIAYPGSFQTLMVSIWGTSAQNIWIAGHNERSNGRMYHFDGLQWSVVPLTGPDGPGGLSFTSVWGFNVNDVWAAGSRITTNSSPPPELLNFPFATHFTNGTWAYVPISDSGYSFTRVWGPSSNDVFLPSEMGRLFRLTNGKLKEWIFQSNTSLRSVCQIGGEIHLTGRIFGQGGYDTLVYYTMKDSVWELKDRQDHLSYGSDPRFPQLIYPPFEDAIYARSERSLFEWGGSGWVKLYEAQELIRMVRASKTNILVYDVYGQFAHWNGSDWKQIDGASIPGDPYLIYRNGWTDGREVFILATDISKTYVFRGK